MPAPHHSHFYRPDALPAAQPTASKHWRHRIRHSIEIKAWKTWLKLTEKKLYNAHLTHSPVSRPRWGGTRKVKPIWILLKQETVSGSGISWAIRKSAPSSRQITMPAPHHSLFYRPDALPTAPKHWRQCTIYTSHTDISLAFTIWRKLMHNFWLCIFVTG